jgi:hypothetical protein
MTAEKRKHAAIANLYESKCMRLRVTPARTEHNIKRQRTPNRQRPKAFFEHLPLDVRRIIYDYMVLPPYKEAQECAGLYLSCRQTKNEMEQAAPARLRVHLLEFQRDLARTTKDLVKVQLPKRFDTGSIPINTALDVGITIR